MNADGMLWCFIHPSAEALAYKDPHFTIMPTTNGAIGHAWGAWVAVSEPFKYASPELVNRHQNNGDKTE